MFKTERVKICGGVAELSHEPTDGVVWDIKVISATNTAYVLTYRPKVIKNQVHLVDVAGVYDLTYNGYDIDLVYSAGDR
jgi:hypothetical protein